MHVLVNAKLLVEIKHCEDRKMISNQTFISYNVYLNDEPAFVAQSNAHPAHHQEVMGSIPPGLATVLSTD